MKNYFFILSLIIFASFLYSGPLELAFFLGMADGSGASDGVTVQFFVEKSGQSTKVFEQHWSQQVWSQEFIVNLDAWVGQDFVVNITTSPGPSRSTHYDWIIIGDAKVRKDSQLVYSFANAISTGQFTGSYTLDSTGQTYSGYQYGANCVIQNTTVGGITKVNSFMQHPPWQNGNVGNTISRYNVQTSHIPETSTMIMLVLGLGMVMLNSKKFLLLP
ncbi:MAG: hypothetical protein HUU50_04590 [Candidatus Brocadiae bacterium]|nr:hypothetical protein [Candidatus Brocadiia bacterium]